MPTTRSNLYVDQGTDFYAFIQLFSNDIELNVSDITFFGSVRKVYSSALAFNIRVTIVPNGPTNDVELYIAAEDTIDLEPGKYEYDIMMSRNLTSREKILEGLVIVLPSITRENT
jgi:hypothetical protein